MTRDMLKDTAWFDQWISYDESRIEKMKQTLLGAFPNASYRPQYAYELSLEYMHLMLRRYSRGDPLPELIPYFGLMLSAWEDAERLGGGVWTDDQQAMRHSWKLNLDFYIGCFWRVGLAMTLEVPDSQWQRLLALIGNEGEDELLDRVIATRQPGRSIGTQLCHPKPYRRLLDAIDAPEANRPGLLKAFVTHWYADLDRLPKKGLSRDTAMHERPYWYGYHDMDGVYFGYWCIEAAAVAKTFDIDDSPCLGTPHYPGDLLHDGEASTQKLPAASQQRAAQAAVEIKQTLADRIRRAVFAPRNASRP